MLPKTITIRNPQWDFSDIHNLDAMGTFSKLMWYSLSLVFPEGERYFIRSVKHFQDKIDDPKLQKEIKAFIAQETQHGRMHEKFNEEFILRDTEETRERRQNGRERLWFIEEIINKYVSPKLNLAMTAAAEHYTATWAQNAFDDERVNRLPDSLKNLIYWHAIEEIEHKHVAFDVLDKVDGTYAMRVAGMVVQSFMMGVNLPLLFLRLLRREPNVDYALLLRDIIKESSDEKGLIRSFVTAYWAYMRPGFHPDDEQADRNKAREITEELNKLVNVA
jgi:uncharacterized protein